MEVALERAFREAEDTAAGLVNRTEYLKDDYRLCAGGVILTEYLKSMELALDRINYLKSRLNQLETDMKLYEQQQ